MTFENGGKLRAMHTSNSTGGDKAVIVIESGTFVNNTDKHVIIADYCGSLTVNGGTFSAAADVPVIAVADSTGHVELNTGTYPASVLSVKTKKPDVTKTAGLSVTAPEGYYWKDDTTLTAKVYVASVISADGTTTNKFETIDAAVAAAKDGETLTVLSKDASLPAELPDGVTVVLGAGVEAPAAPDGYKWDETGTLVADKVYAAEIGGVKYETMDAAWEAASGTATITLLADASLTPSWKFVFDAQDITIDLNGHKLDATSAESEDAVFGLSKGKLTVKNGELTVGTLIGGGNAEIVVENATVKGNMNPNGGTLKLVSGDFSEATLTVTPSAVVTKTAGLAVTAPEGYYWKDDTTLTAGSLEPAYAAQIGNVKYETLDAAWDAASGTATITLLADASLTPSWKFVFDAQDITIDLNGHKLDATSAESEDAVFGLSKGKLTVKNGELTVGTLIGGGNAEIVVENATVKGNMDPNGGTLKLVSGDFSEATLTVTPSAVVTKTAGLSVTAPEGYYWKDDTTLTAGSGEKERVELTVNIGDVAVGSVSGAGSYVKGDEVTLTATPNEGYTFVCWSGDVTSTNATVTVTADDVMNVKANFVSDEVYETIAAAAVNAAIERKEVVPVESIKNMALDNPTIEVSDGTAMVGIQLMQATTLNPKSRVKMWTPVKDEHLTGEGIIFDENSNTFKFKLSVEGGTKFFKFVPKNGLQSAE